MMSNDLIREIHGRMVVSNLVTRKNVEDYTKSGQKGVDQYSQAHHRFRPDTSNPSLISGKKTDIERVDHGTNNPEMVPHYERMAMISKPLNVHATTTTTKDPSSTSIGSKGHHRSGYGSSNPPLHKVKEASKSSTQQDGSVKHQDHSVRRHDGSTKHRPDSVKHSSSSIRHQDASEKHSNIPSRRQDIPTRKVEISSRDRSPLRSDSYKESKTSGSHRMAKDLMEESSYRSSKSHDGHSHVRQTRHQ
jgi:hypothetical protein